MAALSPTLPHRDRTAGAAWRAAWPFLFFAAALPIGVYGRIVAGWRMPFWFDEAFSGTITAQPDLAALLDWCRHELTGPGFYAPLWLWARIAGTGDAALRFPSLVCSIAAPLVLARHGHGDRRLQLVWAGFALLWAPTLATATEARPYAQLFLLGGLQAVAFLHLMRAPRLPTAFIWAACTALMGLTHYHALAIGLCEGVAFLTLRRRSALRCWPALLAFAPLAGWMALHLPFVLAYGRQHGAIYGTLTASVVPYIPTALLGSPLWGMVVIAIVGGTALMRGRMARAGGVRLPSPELSLAVCGVVAILLELALGFVHSGFVARYLTPSIPTMMFCCVLWVRRMEASDGILVAAVVAAMTAPFGVALHAALAQPTMDEKHLYNFERASDWLAERRPDRLAFLWSDGVGGISADRQVAQVAGFFLHRAGIATRVTVVHPAGDPSTALRAAAGSDARAAILWIANDQAARTRAVPRIAEQDPRWTCRDFGEAVATVTACRRLRP